MKKITPILMVAVLMGSVLVTGCSKPGPSFTPNIYTKTGDWLVHKVNMVLEWEVVETSKYTASREQNRTASAVIKIYPTDPTAFTDQNGDGLPDLSTTDDDTASTYARASIPTFQINKFSAGSSVSPPDQSLSWESVMDGSFLPGDTIYIDNNRATGVKRVVVTVDNYVNKYSSSVWVVMVPVRMRFVLKNPLDNSIFYDSGDMNVQIPVKLPFDSDLPIGQTHTETYRREFTLHILTPFGIAGKYLYDVSVQGTELVTHRSQITNTDVFDYIGWKMDSIANAMMEYPVLGLLPYATKMVAAVFLLIGRHIPDDVGKAVDWGHTMKGYGGEHWLYRGVAS